MIFKTDDISDFLFQQIFRIRNYFLSKLSFLDKYTKGKSYLRQMIFVFLMAQLTILFFLYQINKFNFTWFLYGNVCLLVIYLLVIIGTIISDTINKLNKARLGNKKKVKEPRLNFGFNFNPTYLGYIYSQLNRYGFIDGEKTTLDNCYDVFFKNHLDHSSLIYFSCKLSEVSYIMDKFKILNPGFKPTIAERSKKFYIRNTLLTQKSLSNAKNKKEASDKFKTEIDKIFQPILGGI